LTSIPGTPSAGCGLQSGIQSLELQQREVATWTHWVHPLGAMESTTTLTLNDAIPLESSIANISLGNTAKSYRRAMASERRVYEILL